MLNSEVKICLRFMARRCSGYGAGFETVVRGFNRCLCAVEYDLDAPVPLSPNSRIWYNVHGFAASAGATTMVIESEIGAALLVKWCDGRERLYFLVEGVP